MAQTDFGVSATNLEARVNDLEARVTALEGGTTPVPPEPSPDPGEPDITGWPNVLNSAQGNIDGNAYVVQCPARTTAIRKHPSKNVWFHTLYKGEKWSSGGARTELELDRSPRLANLTQQDMGFWYRKKAGPAITSGWGPCITQTHSDVQSYSQPPLFIRWNKFNKLEFITDTGNAGERIVHGEIPTTEDEWHWLLYRCVTDASGAKSVLKAWYDRETTPRIDKAGFIFGYPTGKWYHKIGPYREDANEPIEIYYTGHTFGTDLSALIGNPPPLDIGDVLVA